eukprot:6428484-Pyramimonas_sp.AAC.1
MAAAPTRAMGMIMLVARKAEAPMKEGAALLIAGADAAEDRQMAARPAAAETPKPPFPRWARFLLPRSTGMM